jgi:transcriptional regulator with XRE-family HTH domain
LSEHIGKRARAAREALALTQAEVAEELGMSAEAYGRLERGKMMPSVPTLWKLCRILQVTADALLGLDGAPALRLEDRKPRLRVSAQSRVAKRVERLSPGQQRLIERLARELARH